MRFLKRSNLQSSPAAYLFTLLFLCFSIAQLQAQDEGRTLTWQAPTKNTDGTTLTDLAGYRIYNGSQRLKDVGNVTQYPVGQLGLSGGTHRITTTAYNRSGMESVPSNYIDVAIKQTTQTYTLTLSKSGSGGGTITSSSSSLSCGTACSAGFNAGTVVTLNAVPDSLSIFSGWSGGGCSGTSPCSVIVSAAKSVSAAFTLKTTSATVQITEHPQSSTVTVGASASFSCAFTPADAAVQWLRNDSIISGATAAVYQRQKVTLSDNASKYRCRVSKSSNTVLSNAATLSVQEQGSGGGGQTGTTYSLSGKVLLGTRGIAGVSVSTAGKTATTNLKGLYTINGLAGGSYRLEASIAGYALTPAGWVNPVALGSKNLADLDFAAQCGAGYVQSNNKCVIDGPNCSSLVLLEKRILAMQKRVAKQSRVEDRLQQRLSAFDSRAAKLVAKFDENVARNEAAKAAALAKCAEKAGQAVPLAQCLKAQRYENSISKLQGKLAAKQAGLEKRKGRLDLRIDKAAQKTQATIAQLEALQQDFAKCVAS